LSVIENSCTDGINGSGPGSPVNICGAAMFPAAMTTDSVALHWLRRL
jgi:hypothetical protein